MLLSTAIVFKLVEADKLLGGGTSGTITLREITALQVTSIIFLSVLQVKCDNYIPAAESIKPRKS